MRRAGLLLAGLAFPVIAEAQTPDPFVLPPPTQRPQQAPGQGAPPPSPSQPTQPAITMETLVRQGFEVRGMERTSDRSADFVVILQRSGEVRTCLMRINRDANRNLQRQTVCF